MKINKGLIHLLPLLLVGILILVGGYGMYWYGKQSGRPIISKASPSPEEMMSHENEEWKVYVNEKYGYSLKYPSNYLIGFADIMRAEFIDATGEESQLDIYKTENDQFSEFLQIQVFPIDYYSKQIAELVSDIYKQNESHFETTEISTLQTINYHGYSAYEFTYSGKSMSTPQWGGVVSEGNYKVLMLEKDNYVYSIYLRNTDIFNQILDSFEFVE